MIKFLKKNWYYFLLFILIFVFYLFFFSFGAIGDSLNNYGFSHAIRMGEIPYKDFNMVSTPLYAFIMSIGLFIWDNHIMFLIEQSIIFTIMFYMISKILGKKGFFLLLAFLSFECLAFNTTYNFFTLFLLVFILYLEKFHCKKDMLIGFVIGLSIMTKHTLGLFFIIPSIIFYWKDLKRLLRRFIGLLIPCIYFLLYFLFYKSFYNLLDLCLFGLFDFGGKNKIISIPIIIIVIVMILIFIIYIIKDKKNILNYYLLLSIFFVIPIIDLHHFSFFFVCFIIFILQYLKFKPFIIIYIIFSLLWIFSYFSLYLSTDFIRVPDYKHMEYSYFPKLYVDEFIVVSDMSNEYGDNIILLSYDTMLYEIITDNKIDYYGVFLNGNYGYNGTDKIINRLNNEHGKYVFIENKSYNDGVIGKTQFPYKVCDYIMNNNEFINEKNGFKIYYIK